MYSVKELIEVRKEKQLEYLFFYGHKKLSCAVDQGCFSQWYSFSFSAMGFTFPTAEHYMMWEKARLFEDFETADKILGADHPSVAKKLGRKAKNFNPKLWDEHKFDIVVRGNTAKFTQNDVLGDFLLSTGDRVLVEASPSDKIWGIGMSISDATSDPTKWRGENLLGFALMKVREEMRNG